MVGRHTPEEIKRINHLRYRWHERVIADKALHAFPMALLIASYVMHRFNSQLGFAEFSFSSAAKELNMHRTSVIRGRDKLVDRGWLTLLSKPETRTRAWRAARYSLSGGPDDLALDEHTGGHTDETDEVVT